MDEASTTVDAPPEQVWALVTDITRMGEWSPECTGGRWILGAAGPTVGARFLGFNRHGLVRWLTRCRVTECEEPRRFGFEVAENGMTWGWRLEPDGAGTRLTQWRERSGPVPLLARLFVASGVAGRDREDLMVAGMERTLAAVRTATTASP